MQHVANVSERARPARAQAAIEVERLSHIYAGPRRRRAGAGRTSRMTVGAGRFVVIVGPSGCGKTSLLMMMAGLRHQTAGTILCARPADRRRPTPTASASSSRRRACFPGSPRSTTSSSR